MRVKVLKAETTCVMHTHALCLKNNYSVTFFGGGGNCVEGEATFPSQGLGSLCVIPQLAPLL